MKDSALIITSIAECSNTILKNYAKKSSENGLLFIMIGDSKSPKKFHIPGCSYYSVSDQRNLGFKLSKNLPLNHYARKNIGYLIAIKSGKKIIIETDDDNAPLPEFWVTRKKSSPAIEISNGGWINVYKYFTNLHIWPRGFALEEILKTNSKHYDNAKEISAPIQQGLANGNPDVDAIYRLTLPLPLEFNSAQSVALSNGSICPFNSQNTTWFEEAFPLMYLPSYCSFRMTDIWRSFIAQRISWACGWPILFHGSTVFQERNAHSLMNDFSQEIVGYLHNPRIVSELIELDLDRGKSNIPKNMRKCYNKLIEIGVIEALEMPLLEAWLENFV